MAVGTLGYLAPEVIRGERAGEAADVFAVGAVLALAATGQPPFGVDSEKVVLQRVLGGLVDTRGLSADQARLVLSLTASDAADRPTAAHAAGGSAGHSGPASTHLTLAHWALATRNLELPVAQTTLAPVPAPRAVVSGRRRWWRGLPYLMIPAAALLWLTTSPDLAASSTAPSSIAPSASSTSPASSPSSVRPTASASRTSQPESTPAVPDAATGSASSTTSTGIAPPAAPVTQPAVPTARPAPTTQTPAPPTQADSLATTYPFEGGSVKVLGVTPSAGDGGTGRITVEITATERYTGAYALMVSLRGPDSAFAHYFHCLYMGAGTTVVEDVETADFGGVRWNTIVVERQISTSCGKDVAPTY